MADPTLDTPVSVIDWMRVKISETHNAKSAASLRQALEAFVRFTAGTEITFAGFTVDLLQEWIARLFVEGYTIKTVTYYLKNLSALYGRAVVAGIAPATDAFSKVIDRMSDPEWENFFSSFNPHTFDKLQSLVRLDMEANRAAQLAKDIILFSICCGGLTFSELTAYKKGDYKGTSPLILKMVGRYATPKNKYLFPIDRHHRTPKQLSHTVELMFWHLLSKVGLTLSPNPENTARDFWCATALRCGIPFSEILAFLSNSGKLPSLGINDLSSCSVEISSDRVEQLEDIVIEALTDNREYWFAMQLRPHVTPEMIFNRLAVENLSLSQTFYPMEDIVRRIGKKKVVKTKPVISGLMFFRYRLADLGRLFSRIGDLAWGYRYSFDPRSPYAMIPQREMDSYQRAIGMFTEDTELQPVGTIPLNEGDRLIIIGGLFAGRPATLQKIEIQKINPSSSLSFTSSTLNKFSRPSTITTQSSGGFSISSTGDSKSSGRFSKSSTVDSKSSDRLSKSLAGDSNPNTKTVYRLLLPGDNKCEWAVETDPRLVRKITEQEYHHLTAPQP